jgi:hypothetical protein
VLYNPTSDQEIARRKGERIMKPLVVVFAIALTAGGMPALGQTGLCSFIDSHDLSAVKPPLELLGDAGTAKKIFISGERWF